MSELITGEQAVNLLLCGESIQYSLNKKQFGWTDWTDYNYKDNTWELSDFLDSDGKTKFRVKDMSELISGKEALIAKLNGKDVQYNLGRAECLEWSDLTDRELHYWQGERYVNEELGYKFRLKPQTIKINGIDVPKPDYIVDTPHDYDGCWEINIGGTYYLFKTEQNYKQVVEALRSVFNG